jgi:hypothetical protein
MFWIRVLQVFLHTLIVGRIFVMTEYLVGGRQYRVLVMSKKGYEDDFPRYVLANYCSEWTFRYEPYGCTTADFETVWLQ